MRRLLLGLAPLTIACTMRSGCESGTARHDVDGVQVEVVARAVKEIGIGGAGIPHVGGVLWPQFDGYGIELRLHVDARPPAAVKSPAADPDVEPDADELEAAARSLRFVIAPGHEHLAFRGPSSRGWTVLHLLPQGVPFRSKHSDVVVADEEEPDWDAFESPETLALTAIRTHQLRGDVSAAIEAQEADQPWNDALLQQWPRRGHDILHARIEARRDHDPTFVEAATAKALAEIVPKNRALRSAVHLILALGQPSAIAEMDERLLAAVSDPTARGLLARRVARVPTLGRKHPPGDDLIRRARTALDATRD